jgi:hypothetical protein
MKSETPAVASSNNILVCLLETRNIIALLSLSALSATICCYGSLSQVLSLIGNPQSIPPYPSLFIVK